MEQISKYILQIAFGACIWIVGYVIGLNIGLFFFPESTFLWLETPKALGYFVAIISIAFYGEKWGK